MKLHNLGLSNVVINKWEKNSIIFKKEITLVILTDY